VRRLCCIAAIAATITAFGGCGKRTEMVVTTTGDSLDVPGDIQTLIVKATLPARDPMGLAPTYQSAPLTLCAPGQSSGCYSFPISVTLFPGTKEPSDAVRVEVDAFGTDTSMPVTSEASVFTFTPDASERLDFALTKSCLNLLCAQSDQSCDVNGNCVRVTPSGPGNPMTMGTGMVSFVGSTAGMNDTSGDMSLTFDAPLGTVEGDTLLFIGSGYNCLNLDGPPPGYRLLTSFQSNVVRTFWATRSVGPSEGPATLQTHCNAFSWLTLAYRGVKTVTGVLTDQQAFGNNTLTSETITAPNSILLTEIGGSEQMTEICTIKGATRVTSTGNFIVFQLDEPLPGDTGTIPIDCVGNGVPPADLQIFQLVLAPQ
jgi:hypothetical protein